MKISKSQWFKVLVINNKSLVINVKSEINSGQK